MFAWRAIFKNNITLFIKLHETKYFNVFFNVESKYETGFSLNITVFAAEGETIIILHPVYSSNDQLNFLTLKQDLINLIMIELFNINVN